MLRPTTGSPPPGPARAFKFALETLEARSLPSFAGPVSYTIGTQNLDYAPSAPVNVATADFNADGRLDLAVVHTGDSSVDVLLGSGDGTFQPAARYTVTDPAQGDVFVGDFNNDGRPDLFLPASGTGSNIFISRPSVLLGNGDGTFQTPLTSSSFGPSRGWAVGEFTRDGRLDLVSTNPTTGTVTVLPGNGDGTFQPAITGPRLFPNSRGVTVADFNGDGRSDLAVASGTGRGTNTGTAEVTVLLGNGDGTFTPSGRLPSPQVGTATDIVNPEVVVAADVNGDGRIDVIASNNSSNVNVFLGNGDGTFQRAIGVVTGESPRSVQVVDVNADGTVDLVVTNVGLNVGGAEFADYGARPGSVAVLLGYGDGTFQRPIPFEPFAHPGWTAVGDFNADGAPDLAVTRVFDGHSVNVLLNQPTVPFRSRPRARRGLAFGSPHRAHRPRRSYCSRSAPGPVPRHM